MAIRTEALIVAPPFPERPEPIPRRLTELEAAWEIKKRIETVAKFGNGLLGLLAFGLEAEQHLFDLDAGEDGLIRGTRGHRNLALERGNLQDVGVFVMKQYGFDQNISNIKSTVKLGNGVTTEHRVYPSQTVRGLEFHRTLDYVEVADAPVFVSWTAKRRHG